MKLSQEFLDKMSIGLSLACAIHCLASPILVALLPSIVATQFEGETFHILMVAVVLPVSAYALTMGCRQHQRYGLLVLGGFGVMLLVAALVVGEALLGGQGETILTLLGGAMIALGHFWNFRLCRQHANCPCPDS